MSIIVKGRIDASGQLTLLEPSTLVGPIDVDVEIHLDTTWRLSSATRPAAQPSTVLAWQAKYRPVAQLGAGGMGVTYQAEDANTGVMVCVKQLHVGTPSRSLLQECRALSRLSHRAIVRLLDFDTMADPPYLVLEFVDGAVLSDVQQARRLSDDEIHVIVKRVGEALAFAHSNDVIHRDLKPGNIILGGGQAADTKVLDFGLAVVAQRDHEDNLTASGNVAGTMLYMAPEQLAGERLSAACDVYALGQIWWELLAGARPFGIIPSAIIQAKMETNGLELPVTARDVGDRASLIRSMTLRNPLARPSAAAVLAELSR